MISSICYADKFTGTVLCKETGKPIEYANIGIVGKNVGTTTDIDGKFTINLDNVYNYEEIRISIIGFETLAVKVSEFKKSFMNGSAIYLSEHTVKLEEVVVKLKKPRHRRLGIAANNNMIVAGFDSSLRGYETGVLMKIREIPTYIDSVEINVCSCVLDSIFFRLNIYESIDSDFVNILHEPIYISIPIQYVKNHKIKVDLSKKNIMVSHNFLVSAEIVKDLGWHKMFFCAGLFANKGYVRKTSQGNWKKIPDVAPAISAYVSY